MAEANKTKTYRATERGYVDGRIVEEGETFTTGEPKGSWMEPIKGSNDSAVDRAVADAQADRKDDPALEELSLQALQALATDAGVTSVKGLSKKDLITALRAADEQRRM